MQALNVINLIQAGTVTAALLGGLLLWRSTDFRGVALLFGLIAIASLVNIFEEAGGLRGIYLISPAFVVLVGPATYLAACSLTQQALTQWHYLHLAPGVLALGFTDQVQWVIAVGTVMRLIYAVLTGLVLLRYTRVLREERSDSDEFSFTWLVWVFVVMTAVNFVDLARLNFQTQIGADLNLLGQGINNLMWLMAVMLIAVKLLELAKVPRQAEAEAKGVSEPPADSGLAEYEPIFRQLDSAITSNEWYRQPRLTLSDLSQLSGLTSRDISRDINLIAERSFNDYINGLRVEFVRATIAQHPEHSMTRVAANAGFSSKASFNQSFKKALGLTPSEYKMQQTG